VPVVGTALLIMAGSIATNGVSSALSIRPLTWIGDLSYSWYLWHWPLIVFAGALYPTASHSALIGAAISIVPAWLSYRYVENPIRFNPSIKGLRALGVAAVCIALPIACSLVLLKAPKPSPSASTKLLLTTREAGQDAVVLGCGRGKPLNALPAYCTFSVEKPKGRVVLLGDSNAGHFVPAASAASKLDGYDFTIGTYPECPFVDLVITQPQSQQSSSRCRNFVSATLRQLVKAKPALVMLGASSPLYLTNTTTFHDPVTGETTSSRDAKAKLWTTGLHRVVQKLADAHIPVVVLSTVPQWPSWSAKNCAEIRVYLAPRSCGTSEGLASVASYRNQAIKAEHDAIRGLPNVVSVDFVNDLCPGGRCTTNRGDLWIYSDGMHLSARGSRTLIDHFKAFIQTDAAA
jgi:hypothetical protein